MKTKLLFVGLLLGAASLTSCKKDWTCECTTSVNGVSTTASSTMNATKSDAEEACESGTTSSNVMGVESSTECVIL